MGCALPLQSEAEPLQEPQYSATLPTGEAQEPCSRPLRKQILWRQSLPSFTAPDCVFIVLLCDSVEQIYLTLGISLCCMPPSLFNISCKNRLTALSAGPGLHMCQQFPTIKGFCCCYLWLRPGRLLLCLSSVCVRTNVTSIQHLSFQKMALHSERLQQQHKAHLLVWREFSTHKIPQRTQNTISEFNL